MYTSTGPKEASAVHIVPFPSPVPVHLVLCVARGAREADTYWGDLRLGADRVLHTSPTIPPQPMGVTATAGFLRACGNGGLPEMNTLTREKLLHGQHGYLGAVGASV